MPDYLLFSSRSLTKDERKNFEDQIIADKKLVISPLRALGCSAITSFVLCGLGFVLGGAPVKFFAAMFVGITFVLFLFVWVSDRLGYCRRVRCTKSVLMANMALTARISSNRFYEFAELDDEGPTLAYQLDAKRIVFVSGYEYLEDEHFPNDDFEIVQYLDENRSKIDTALVPYGKKIESVRTFRAEQRKGMRFVDQYEIVYGSLEDIEALLAVDRST